MKLIRREDVLRLITAVGANHGTAIRAEEEKAAASGVKLAAYSYAIDVLATLGVAIHNIPAFVPAPTVAEEEDYAHSDFLIGQAEAGNRFRSAEAGAEASVKDEGSPTEVEEEVNLHE